MTTPDPSADSPTDDADEPSTSAAATWWGRTPTNGRFAVLAVAILVVLVVVIVATRGGGGPADGTSCVGMSDSNITAWVKANAGALPGIADQLVASGDVLPPADTNVGDVAASIEQICLDAQVTDEPQTLDTQLLAVGIENAG